VDVSGRVILGAPPVLGLSESTCFILELQVGVCVCVGCSCKKGLDKSTEVMLQAHFGGITVDSQVLIRFAYLLFAVFDRRGCV